MFESVYVKPADIEGLATYNKDLHMWVLDVSVLKSMMPNARSDEQLARKALSYSRHIYNWLYKNVVTTQNRSLVEFLISCTIEGRNAMLNALQEQAEADAESNINTLSISSPVDLATGNVIDEDLLRSASIALYAKDLLTDASVLVGNNRFYFNKRFDYGVRFNENSYTELEY